MWPHLCKPERAIICVEAGQPCNWCDCTPTQTDARALTDAGYMTVADYLRLYEENEWT